jgi:hypothetical protein
MTIDTSFGPIGAATTFSTWLDFPQWAAIHSLAFAILKFISECFLFVLNSHGNAEKLQQIVILSPLSTCKYTTSKS